MANTSNIDKSKSKSKSRSHSTGSKTQSKPRNSFTRAGVGNPCDDQNGVILCWGGHQTNKPFPTTGGPWVGVVSYNSQTGLMEWQWADLTTLCPGSTVEAVPSACRPCEGAVDVEVAPIVEPDQL